MEEILHTLSHTFLDSLEIVPFLFLTYLFMEWLEHRSGERSERLIKRSGRASVVVAALLGLVPQCAFSSVAAGLYSGHIISMGTLMATFLATSDEMIPVFISEGFGARKIIIILALKFVLALVAGFLVDLFVKRKKELPFEMHCEEEGCHCHEKGIFKSALYHTVKIFFFIFIFNFVIHIALELFGEDRLSSLFSGAPVLSCVLSSVIGLIPSCASSVVIATLYLENVIGAGAMMSGLFVGAGTGLLVLFRVNHSRRENLIFVTWLFVIGTLSGILLDFVGLGAVLS